MKKRFDNYKIVKLLDVATAERAQKGKIYERGSMLIALSATKGQIEYLEKDGEVDTRYAVITPHDENDRFYIYQATLKCFDDFLRQWKTGINLKFENLKHIEIHLHDYETQKEISQILQQLDQAIEREEALIKIEQERKKYFLSGMFAK